MYDYGIKRKLRKKKWRRQWWNFNHKFLNNSLIDTSIWIAEMIGRWCGWKPSKRNIILLEIKKVITIRCNYFVFCSTEMEWSAAPSIFNIKARGLAHCLLWIKLGLDEVYEMAFHAMRASNNDRHTQRFRNCKKLECLYEQNKSNETIWRLLINTVPAYMPIDEMPVVRSFLCSL